MCFTCTGFIWNKVVKGGYRKLIMLHFTDTRDRVLTIDIVPFQVNPTIWKVEGSLKSCMKKATNAPAVQKRLQFNKRVHVRYYLSRPLVEYKGIRKIISNLKGKFPVTKGCNSTSSRRFKRTNANFIPSRITSVRRRLSRIGGSLTRWGTLRNSNMAFKTDHRCLSVLYLVRVLYTFIRLSITELTVLHWTYIDLYMLLTT